MSSGRLSREDITTQFGIINNAIKLLQHNQSGMHKTGDHTNHASVTATATGPSVTALGSISVGSYSAIDIAGKPYLESAGMWLFNTTVNKHQFHNGTQWVTLDGGGSSDLISDTSPQLGGDLDVSGHDIVTTSNADIDLDPHGTGSVVFKGNTTRGSGSFKLKCENNSHGITIKGPPHSAAASYTLTLPNNDGDADQVLKTDGSGTLAWVDQASGGVPIYSTTERNALSGITKCTVISNSTTGTLQMYNNNAWTDITTTIFQFLVDYLVIAGGGAGAADHNVAPGGGGGAGGYRTTYVGAGSAEKSGGDTTPESKPTVQLGTSYSVQVGAGGAFGFGTYNGNPGTNSVFHTITSTGGGGGATGAGSSSTGGGSGGGGKVNGSGGTATTGQGFGGGTGATDSGSYYAGGGGGAGGAGQNGYPSNGGDGGVGIESSITGAATFRGGGGGGGVQGPQPTFAGAGGNGGGGAANNNAGTDGTGGGGGGNSGSGQAGRGGDGIIILRYPNTYTISAVGFTGLTMSSETAVGSDKYVSITCTSGGTTGTGSVTWA